MNGKAVVDAILRLLAARRCPRLRKRVERAHGCSVLLFAIVRRVHPAQFIERANAQIASHRHAFNPRLGTHHLHQSVDRRIERQCGG